MDSFFMLSVLFEKIAEEFGRFLFKKKNCDPWGHKKARKYFITAIFHVVSGSPWVHLGPAVAY